MLDIKAKLKEYSRVVRVARKPNKDEFSSASKICLLGIALIGTIGFMISVLFILGGI